MLESLNISNVFMDSIKNMPDAKEIYTDKDIKDLEKIYSDSKVCFKETVLEFDSSLANDLCNRVIDFFLVFLDTRANVECPMNLVLLVCSFVRPLATQDLRIGSLVFFLFFAWILTL